MADNNPKKNIRLMERNYRYKQNYIAEANSIHRVSEYQPKEDAFELLKKQIQNRFDECRKRHDRVQNDHINHITI